MPGVEPPVRELDIALYRDDVFDGMSMPEVGPTHLPFEVRDRDHSRRRCALHRAHSSRGP